MISDFFAPERDSVSFARMRFAASVSSGLSGAGSPILDSAAVASSIRLRRLAPPAAPPDTGRAAGAGALKPFGPPSRGRGAGPGAGGRAPSQNAA